MATTQISQELPVIVKQMYRNGRTSFGVLIPPQFRRAMGLVEHDYLAVRLKVIQGRSFIIMEKLSMAKLARPPELPVDVLPSAR